jgi:bifunctional DNA-binding transcriptional regulator/antitoxin component of YhaV-PrlF toxin-antitoxin module
MPCNSQWNALEPLLRCAYFASKFTVSVVQVGKSLKVTVPKEICEYLGLCKGDTVTMWADDSRLIVEKRRALHLDFFRVSRS